jgi:DNA-binding CsgD family transcriptional regulator
MRNDANAPSGQRRKGIVVLSEYGLLLELYGAACEMNVAEFPQFAFALMHSVLRFDAGRYTSLQFLHPGARAYTTHLHNDSVDTAFDWEQINRHDTVIAAVEAAPGQALGFHARSLFAGRDQAVMRDYIQRTGHHNNLVIGLRDGSGQDLWRSLSLYRSRPDDRYTRRDQRVLEALMPHFVQALRINEALGVCKAPVDAGTRAALAIATQDGAIHFAGPGFVELMRMEWPQWPSARLPACVVDRMRSTGVPGYSGRSIELSVHRSGKLLFMHARASSAVARLSARERRVAALYGAGRSYKAIARELQLSPATIRNHLQHVYAKLGVHGKAQLAVLLDRDGGAATAG